MTHISFRCSPSELEVIKVNARACGMSVYSFVRMATCVIAGFMNATRDYGRFTRIACPRVPRDAMSISLSPAMRKVVQKVAADAGISPALFVRLSAISFTDFNHL